MSELEDLLLQSRPICGASRCCLTSGDERRYPEILEFLSKKKGTVMHYRNGREASNGDKVAMLDDQGQIVAFGVLHSAKPGNDYCNGRIATIQSADQYACLCDCLHVDDIAGLLKEKGLEKRAAGK